MDFITLIFLALALSADAFAVSVTNGMFCNKITTKKALLTGIFFGFFQALMPIQGFFLGKTFSDIVHRYQHWVALFLLGAIGINMLADAIKDQQNAKSTHPDKNIFAIKSLILQGIATSIDALAAGVSLAVLQINIFSASLLIGVVTFFCCFLGVYIGRIFGSLLGIKAKFVGGITLIIIGLKIFIENQFL
ncbi:MAG: manganese efflux pump MntP family protein [Herbinix sp.]|nr:manganese efflux pump MntP family protein [Herbinix sp.]